jgi:hypothetical protein
MTQYRDLITGLSREYHHIKVRKENDEEWSPAMVITRNRIKGRSFIILLEGLWKYLDPINNSDPKVLAADMEEFEKLMSRCETRESLAVDVFSRGYAIADHVCIEMAGLLNKSHGFLLCTAYNLAKCMQMVEIDRKSVV